MFSARLLLVFLNVNNRQNEKDACFLEMLGLKQVVGMAVNAAMLIFIVFAQERYVEF